jgi:hypothetical protein
LLRGLASPRDFDDILLCMVDLLVIV